MIISYIIEIEIKFFTICTFLLLLICNQIYFVGFKNTPAAINKFLDVNCAFHTVVFFV